MTKWVNHSYRKMFLFDDFINATYEANVLVYFDIGDTDIFVHKGIFQYSHLVSFTLYHTPAPKSSSFWNYLPPALPNRLSLYAGAITCNRYLSFPQR